jgi:hypothetical protein
VPIGAATAKPCARPRVSDLFLRVVVGRLLWFVPKKKPADLQAVLLFYFGVYLRRNTDLPANVLFTSQ